MYEVIAILNPNTTTEVLESKISDWTKIIQEHSAELLRTERWGKKNLAYEVKKFHQGIFVLFHIEGKHDVIMELERRFRIADEVIRYQSVKLSEIEYKASIELLDGLKREFIEGDNSHDDPIRKRFSGDFSDNSDNDDDSEDDDNRAMNKRRSVSRSESSESGDDDEAV